MLIELFVSHKRFLMGLLQVVLLIGKLQNVNMSSNSPNEMVMLMQLVRRNLLQCLGVK